MTVVSVRSTRPAFLRARSTRTRVHADPDYDRDRRIREIKEDRDTARDAAVSEFASFPAVNNGDEKRFAYRSARGKEGMLDGFASFTKALAHDDCGLVKPEAFDSLLRAVEIASNTTSTALSTKAFEKVKLGGLDAGLDIDKIRLLANPLNSYSTQLIGNDSNGARMAPAPKFGSRNSAVDMVERYWMALCRDVPFEEYGKNKLTLAAIDDLNDLGFKKEFGFQVTPQNLFRGPYEGCDVGPMVSQFLLQDFNFGNQRIEQIMKFPKPGLNYLTDLDSWMKVNNGEVDPTGQDILNTRRRMYTLRDAGQWVHIDFPHQSGLYATLQLVDPSNIPGIQASDAIPYPDDIMRSDPFGSLGGPDSTVTAALAGVYALKHAWYQKWAVHRRLRPEVYAQRLELFRRGLIGVKDVGVPPKDPFESGDFRRLFRDGADVWRKTKVLAKIFELNKESNKGKADDGTWLLPMGYPEGSPTHPAYPGGHSCFVAAAATIAKAFFKDQAFPGPSKDGKFLGPVEVDPNDQTKLRPFTGEDADELTVHGELNKLIANVTLFRDGAGMHWRTDGTASSESANVGRTQLETGGNLLGEAMAVSMLRDLKTTYREELGDFCFKGISGNLIVI